MGNYFNKIKPLKRKHSNVNVEYPVIKRFRSTFDYLYQKLFVEGEGSDVTIYAFDKSWKLHKLYICQAPFFASMFSGNWIENNLKEINLEFADSNITADALHIVFSSFYYDSFELLEDNVISVTATSIWFQLNDLQTMCEDFIIYSLNLNNVVKFYELSILYGMIKLSEKCIEWISSVILKIEDCKEFFIFLQTISSHFMLKIISNPKLFVIQIEQDVFILLLKWLYLRLFPKVDIAVQNVSEIVCNYFKSENPNIDDINESPDIIYKLFEAVRWEHTISTVTSASDLVKFSIIPNNLLMSAYKNQWIRMLKSNESKSRGPPSDLKAELFWKYSERCGRHILKDINTTWRWSTYKYDIDIIIRYINREFYIIRYIDLNNFFNWVKHVPEKRKLKLHFTIASYIDIENEGIIRYPKIIDRLDSGLISLELSENLPIKILSLPVNFEFPLILSANFLRFDPFCCSTLSENDIVFQENRTLDNSSEHIFSII